MTKELSWFEWLSIIAGMASVFIISSILFDVPFATLCAFYMGIALWSLAKGAV
jgi:hypothetical protein